MKTLAIIFSLLLPSFFAFAQNETRGLLSGSVVGEDGKRYSLCAYDYDKEKSEDKYKKNLTAEPIYYPVNEYAYFLIKNNRYQEAIELIEKSLYPYRNYLNIEMWNNGGKAYLLMGNKENALEYYKKAQKWHGGIGDPYVWFNLCEYYHVTGKKAKAKKYARKVVKSLYDEETLKKMLRHMDAVRDTSDLLAIYDFKKD